MSFDQRLKNVSLRTENKDSEISIVGLSCRFPGGLEGPAKFWDAIRTGQCTVGKVPFSRWDVDAVTASDPTLSDDAKRRMMWGGFVDDLELFDNSFFKISSAEASAMDPQQRLLLEYSYLACADGGYDWTSLQNANIGVFVGIMASDVNDMALRPQQHPSTGPGRVSYSFGLTGPSASFDTACSSSITALHAGVRALQHSECEAAIAVSYTHLTLPTKA